VPSLSHIVNRGVDLLQQGRPGEAAALLRGVLDRAPRHADALHLLAVALFQQGDTTGAVEAARKAVRIDPRAADYRSNLGRYLFAAGHIEAAASELRAALARQPSHPQARFNMACVKAAQGRRQEAADELRQYVSLHPRDPAGHLQLGNVLADLFRPAEAAASFRAALALDDSLAEAHNNLSNALQALGRYEESLAGYERALALRPRYADAASNYGAALQALGRLEEAGLWYERALEWEPGLIQARGNRANLLAARGRHEEAVAAYRELLKEIPHSAETWNNLGNALQELGRFEEACEAFDQALRVNPNYYLVHNNIGNTLRRQGRYDEAMERYRRVLGHDPDFVEALNNLAVALLDTGRGAEAVGYFERALALRPSYADPLINLSNWHRDCGRLDEAVGCLRRALAIAPGNAHIWNNLGCSLGDRGEVAEAIACFRRALELMPANWQAHSNLLLNLHYIEGPAPEEIAREHREFGRRHAPAAARFRQPCDNEADPDRPLRIGYVSADFRRHSVAFFLEPVIERHDRERFAVFCYSDVARPDGVTARFQALVRGGWRDVRGCNHERFAARVRADRIDILVDTGGHTANSRLLSFAAAPAPVQVSWLGYPDTTGLAEIGYRITDAWTDPPGETERFHTERLERIDGGFLCFRPPAEAPAPAPAPHTLGLPFTFGSFNNMAKISDATLALWAAILRHAPGARLAVKNKALTEPDARRRLTERFAALGVDASRLMLAGPVESLTGHLDAYRHVDLALDTYPYHGTTTTCEALWMGVPVLTRLGPAHVSRVGLTLLAAAGCQDLAVSTAEDYVRRAVALAADPTPLAALRPLLRPRLAASPLTAEREFTARLEAAYRRMWRRWCREQNQPQENPCLIAASSS